MNNLGRGGVVLLALIASRAAGGETVTGRFDLDALPDALTYGDPDEAGVVTIEIALARGGGSSERLVRKYPAGTGSHVVILSRAAGEITVHQFGDLAQQPQRYATFSYNSKKKDWFLTRDVAYQPRGGEHTPRIDISYPGGVASIGGVEIDDADAEIDGAEVRRARLRKELSTLHEHLTALYNAHRLATAPGDAWEVLRLSEMILNVPVTRDTVEEYNNVGFFLGENRDAISCGAFVLEKVVEAQPDRTVAYLNLADVYFKLEAGAKAKACYAKYIERMKRAGKASKIPRRALERVG